MTDKHFELSPVAQAIQRGPHTKRDGQTFQPIEVIDATEYTPASDLPGPVGDAVTLLQGDGHQQAANELAYYVEQQRDAIKTALFREQHADTATSVFMENVAALLCIHTNSSGDEILAALQLALAVPPAPEPVPITEAEHSSMANMGAVLEVLANYHLADPAVTPDNAAGLVQGLIEELAKRDLAHNRREVALAQESADMVPLSTLRQLLIAHGHSQWEEDPVTAINDMLNALQGNQKPEGWDSAVDVLVNQQKRYEHVISLVEHALKLK